jgi:hypothetical protein
MELSLLKTSYRIEKNLKSIETKATVTVTGKYEINGHFYTQKIAGHQENLRSILEIKRTKTLKNTPDFVVIMMNPGSSTPIDENTIQKNWKPNDKKEMSKAKPDKTQFQLMRLMDEHCFDYFSIINLSDLRTPKSPIFYEKLKKYKNDISHSIFDNSRSDELKSIIGNTKSPILAAWGLHLDLLLLGNLANEQIEDRKIIGIKHSTLNLFKHPLPPRYDWQVEWIKQISQQIENLTPRST